MLGEPAPEPFAPALLRPRDVVERAGVDPGRAGWQHVRRGYWVEGALWSTLTPEQRHAALVHATDLACRRPGRHVYALASAAAVWGMPRVEAWPEHVTVLATGPRTRGSRRIHVHVGVPTDGVAFGGVRVTDPARTVVDLARTGSLPTALSAADHGLRHALFTRDELLAAAEAVPPRVRGRPTAGVVARLADGRAMSAGESLSRAQMYLLGLPRPELQVPLEDADGAFGLADFGWPGVVGEFDGRVKYRVPVDAEPEEAGVVLWREKLREDRIRRFSRVARWVWAEAMSPSLLAGILAEQGVRPDPGARWLGDDTRRAS